MRTSATNYPANFSVETRIDAGTANGGRFPSNFFMAALMSYDAAKDEEVYPYDFTYGLRRSPMCPASGSNWRFAVPLLLFS